MAFSPLARRRAGARQSRRLRKVPMRKILGAAWFVLSCSTLPEYAAPKEASLDGTDALAGDLIPYRTLTRGDFKGKEAPEAFRAVADKVGAATCARIVSDPPAEIEITETTAPSGEKSYSGHIKTIGYRALMDRGCSWWNDQASELDPAYVLQHEQIHFAIFEVEARRLNHEVQELIRGLKLNGSSVEDIQRKAESEIRDRFDDTTDRVMDRNTDFDEDTSLGYEPKKQQEWFDDITQELEQTKSYQ